MFLVIQKTKLFTLNFTAYMKADSVTDKQEAKESSKAESTAQKVEDNHPTKNVDVDDDDDIADDVGFDSMDGMRRTSLKPTCTQ